MEIAKKDLDELLDTMSALTRTIQRKRDHMDACDMERVDKARQVMDKYYSKEDKTPAIVKSQNTLTPGERYQAMCYIIDNASGFEGKSRDEIIDYLMEKGDEFIKTLAGGLQKDFYFGQNSRI